MNATPNSPGVIVVGTGFGARIHVPALQRAGFVVEALVGRDPERTKRRAAKLGVPAMTSVTEALAIDGVVAATVATHPSAHAPVVLEVVAAGKHVICEKPFAVDAVEARSMRDAAAAAGVVGLIGHEFRYTPERALGGRLIAEGRIGEPRLASFIGYTPLVPSLEARVPGWWFDVESGGGWLGASGSHLIDQARTWLGDLAVVAATVGLVSERDRATHADDTFSILARSASGADVVLQQTGGAWGAGVNVTRVAGTRGTVWLERDEVWLADAEGTRVVSVPDDLALPRGPDAVDGEHRFSHLEREPYVRLCQRFRAAIEGDAAAVGAATFDDGVAVMDVIDAARRASRLGVGAL